MGGSEGEARSGRNPWGAARMKKRIAVAIAAAAIVVVAGVSLTTGGGEEPAIDTATLAGLTGAERRLYERRL